MSFDPDKPYNDLPLLPPQIEIESKAVLKKAIAANKALAELKGAGELIPNQGVLIQSIALQEAKQSSEIENIVTTNDELYRAFADEGLRTNPHTKEVLNYDEALWYGFKEIRANNRPLTTNLFVELYQIIKQTSAGVRRVSGTKLASPQGETIYTPPDGEELLRDKLANLERFIYSEDGVDPLVKLAIMHYQFEAIHPFTDGNGRTGRILNILYLVERNLLDIPVLYLSRFIIENKKDYYAGLLKVTKNGAWEPWILYMLDAVERMSRVTRDRIVSIRNQMTAVADFVKGKAPKVYSKDLIEILYSHPYCKIKFLEQTGIGNRQTASVYLKELEAIGILRGVKKGRELYYINDKFLDILIK
ncbi:MAG: Fic family protein [Nitrospinae bacterium]|nr:Fic family protein [Nitrospinota bacterium]